MVPCKILITTPREMFSLDIPMPADSITVKDDKGNIIGSFKITSKGCISLAPGLGCLGSREEVQGKVVDDKDGRIKALIDAL